MENNNKGICEISSLTNFTLNKKPSGSNQPPVKEDTSYETVRDASKTNKGED